MADEREREDMTELQCLRLSTGVDLDVAISGDRAHPPVILLHGFP